MNIFGCEDGEESVGGRDNHIFQTVQSSICNPSTLLKSRAFLVTNTKPRDKPLAAMRKSMVDSYLLCLQLLKHRRSGGIEWNYGSRCKILQHTR